MRRTRPFAVVLITALSLSSSMAQAEPFWQRVRQAITGRARVVPTAAPANTPDTRQACQARLLQLVEQEGWKHEVKGGVLYFAVPPNASASAYVQTCGKQVIEFWKSPRHGTYHHLYTRLGDTNWSRIWSLSSSRWRVPDSGVGVLATLDAGTTERTQKFLEENQRHPNSASNPHGTIGSFNVSGGGGGPNGVSHCTNYWECSRVGPAGESLPQVLGQRWTGVAPGWIRSLMRSGSPGVVAVAVYGRDVRDFSESTLRRYFE
jgi:hypothetical protein